MKLLILLLIFSFCISIKKFVCYNEDDWNNDALFRIEVKKKLRKILHLGFHDTFRAKNTLNKLFKKYPNKTIHDYKTISFINSFLIAFKRSKIMDQKVFFDPLFGLGSIFQTADEYIFLREALEKKLNLKASKNIILTHKGFSSGQNVGSDKIIFARSAVFSKYYGDIAYLKLIHHIYLLLINGKIKFHEIIVKFMAGLNGIKKYKVIISEQY